MFKLSSLGITTQAQRSLALVAATLAAAYWLGAAPALRTLSLMAAGFALAAVMCRPAVGLLLIIVTALLLPLDLATGTEVALNPVTLLLMLLLCFWPLHMSLKRATRVALTRLDLALVLFLLAGLVSLAIGRLTWDPAVAYRSNFWLVQMAQWAIFALSAGAFWLTSHQIANEVWLRRMTATFLLIAGIVACLRLIPTLGPSIGDWTTIAFIRAPLWLLLAGLAGGQLLYNAELSKPWQFFLIACVAATIVYAFFERREAASNWVAVATVAGMLVWLRWTRWRTLLVALLLAGTVIGLFAPAVYEFAGGDDEWNTSGGSRLALTARVVEVTMRNPLTGLGPAAYRPYANARPLAYGHAYWFEPQINSHNNYVDLFSHVGLIGMALFFWFAWELVRLGLRLRRVHRSGFLAGYINGMLAAGAASLVVMTLADWILPFVYNIGFPGFQASVLVWLFMGGLVAIDRLPVVLSRPNE